jgi:hypothetical protein
MKNRFDCWQSREFTDFIEARDVDALVIAGVELVCCVLYAVLGASERGYHYLVPEDLVSGQDAGDGTDNRAVRDYLRHTDQSTWYRPPQRSWRPGVANPHDRSPCWIRLQAKLTRLDQCSGMTPERVGTACAPALR